MDQFVLVPLSVNNSSNDPTIATRQELPKYTTEESPTYHEDRLKKEINQQLNTSASPLVNKILECPRTKLSNSNTLNMDGIDTGVLLKDFAQRLKRKSLTVPDIYFTLLDAASISPNIVVNSHVKGKKEELGSLSKSERQKLQRLYKQESVAYGSVPNMAKAAKLSLSKVREYFNSKTSYTRFTQATRKFKRIRAFARFKKEIWCMDLAYVDKLSKDKKGVKYLLVRQDLFDRTVDARGKKTKDSKETVKTFSNMITKKNRPREIWVDQETEFAAEFKKFCSAGGIKVTLQ